MSQREPSQKFSPRCTKLFLTFIFLSHLFLISLKTNFQSILKKWNVCIVAAAAAIATAAAAAAALHPPHSCTGKYLCMVETQKLTQIKWAQKGPIAHDQNEKEKLRLFLHFFFSCGAQAVNKFKFSSIMKNLKENLFAKTRKRRRKRKRKSPSYYSIANQDWNGTKRTTKDAYEWLNPQTGKKLKKFSGCVFFFISFSCNKKMSGCLFAIWAMYTVRCFFSLLFFFFSFLWIIKLQRIILMQSIGSHLWFYILNRMS